MTSAGRVVTDFFHSEMWKVTALSRLKGHCLTPKAGLQHDVQEFRFQTDFILERRQGDVAAKFHINFKQDLLPSRGSNRKAEYFSFIAVSQVPPCEAFLLSHPTTLKAQTACAAQGPWQFPKLAITQPLYALLTDVVIERKRSGLRCKY